MFILGMKPTRKPEPSEVVSKEVTDVQRDILSYREANQKDLIWQLARLTQNSSYQHGLDSITYYQKETCLWLLSGTCRFCELLQQISQQSTLSYAIWFMCVTKLDTISTDHILVTADMAINSKAQEILWNKPAHLNGRVTIRVGGMHTTMALLASLGKLYIW